MPGYTKATIVLKDAPNHAEYNKRIIEYLKDRHTAINDNMFTIAIDVADETNIDDYALDGMESVPAIQVHADDGYIYGVNSILSTLAKLEIVGSSQPVAKQRSEYPAEQPKKSGGQSDSSAYYDMVMQEMKCDDQEDPDTPSSLKAYNQEVPESPLTEKSIEEKAKAYNSIYDQRRKRNTTTHGKKQHSRKSTSASTTVNVDKFIASGGYDKGEEMFMRQIAENL